MIKFGKKIRQTLTMLLAVSMLAGSVPVSAFAMDGESVVSETEVMSQVQESVVEELDVSEMVSEMFMGEMDNTVSGGKDVVDDMYKQETALSVSENIIEEMGAGENAAVSEGNNEAAEEITVSQNQGESQDELTTTETEGNVEITFSVSENSYSSYVKIIQIDEENLETEVDGNKVTAEVGKALKFRLELAEGYKVTKVTMGNSILPVVDGIYTTYPAAAGNIEITLEELEKYDVVFSYDEELVTDLTVRMDKKDVTLQENVAADMWEGSTVSFTLTLDSMAKVVKVIANEEELKAVDGTTYELKELTEDIEVKIETSLDGKKCNTLDIVVWGHRNSISVLNDGVMYVHGERLLSKDTNEEITVYLDNNYVVDKILLNNVEKKFTGTNTSYNVSFSKENKNQILAATKILEVCTDYMILKEMIEEENEKLSLAAKAYIDEHLSEEINIYELCEYVGTSRTKLYETFKRDCDIGIAAYIKEKRLATARRLLKNTELSVADIAAKVGFYDYNYFSRVYKQKYGISPHKER